MREEDRLLDDPARFEPANTLPARLPSQKNISKTLPPKLIKPPDFAELTGE
jgi:hypothetical protein